MSHEKELATAVVDLLAVCGLDGSHLCGVTNEFNEASAAELLQFAAKLVRKNKARLDGNPNFPEKCNGCGRPLLTENLYADDGCPCNTPRGINFAPASCDVCRTDNCVKPGHRLVRLFGEYAAYGSGEPPDAVREAAALLLDRLENYVEAVWNWEAPANWREVNAAIGVVTAALSPQPKDET